MASLFVSFFKGLFVDCQLLDHAYVVNLNTLLITFVFIIPSNMNLDELNVNDYTDSCS